MKTAMCVVLLVLLQASFISSGTQSPTARNFVAQDSLTLIGHATVKIMTSDGKVIYIDPFQPGDYSDSADIVLITHQHSDHNRLDMVMRKPTCTVITNAEAHPDSTYRSFTIGGVTVTAVPAYNVNHLRNACVGYVVEFNGIKLYHAGDTGNIPEMADLASRNLTYALLPIDGVFTMSPEVATQAATVINAAHNIPMHTMPTPDTFNVANVARFTPANKLVVRHGETIALHVITTADPTPSHPQDSELRQSYPNPFNPTTNIEYQIGGPNHVTLKVYDVLGREVRTLVDEVQGPGVRTIVFDAGSLSGGVYFYTLHAGKFSSTRKLALVR